MERRKDHQQQAPDPFDIEKGVVSGEVVAREPFELLFGEKRQQDAEKLRLWLEDWPEARAAFNTLPDIFKIKGSIARQLDNFKQTVEAEWQRKGLVRKEAAEEIRIGSKGKPNFHITVKRHTCKNGEKVLFIKWGEYGP